MSHRIVRDCTVEQLVWLTQHQRQQLCRQVGQVLQAPESLPWKMYLQQIRQQCCHFNQQKVFSVEGQDVTLTRRGLKLPPDSYPLFISGELIDVIYTLGDLPDELLATLKPSPETFPPTPPALVPCERGVDCVCLS